MFPCSRSPAPQSSLLRRLQAAAGSHLRMQSAAGISERYNRLHAVDCRDLRTLQSTACGRLQGSPRAFGDACNRLHAVDCKDLREEIVAKHRNEMISFQCLRPVSKSPCALNAEGDHLSRRCTEKSCRDGDPTRRSSLLRRRPCTAVAAARGQYRNGHDAALRQRTTNMVALRQTVRLAEN